MLFLNVFELTEYGGIDQVLMEEFVLDVIIERKTINDLCISIVDKRYELNE